MVAETLGSDVAEGRYAGGHGGGGASSHRNRDLPVLGHGRLNQLVQDLGPAVFSAVIERHNAVLRDAFGRHGATERGTQGDSSLVMFPEAPAAVAAAAEAQRALKATEWPADIAVHVRMGLQPRPPPGWAATALRST